MKTTEITLSSGRTITLTRPVFSQMPNAARSYEELLDSETPGDLMTSDDFDRMLRRAFGDEDAYEAFMADADHEEVWEAWAGYVEFARFEAFLTTASEQLEAARQRQMERTMESGTRNFEMMKKLGALPADYSLAQYMQEQLTGMRPQPGTSAGPAPSMPPAAEMKSPKR